MTRNQNKNPSDPTSSERMEVLEGEILEERAAGSSARARVSSSWKPFPGQLIFFAGLIFLAAFLVWLWLDREDGGLATLLGEEATISEDIPDLEPDVIPNEDLEELQRRDTQIENRTFSLESEIAALRDALGVIETRLTELETAPATPEPVVSVAELAAIEERLIQLEERFQENDESFNTDPAAEVTVATVATDDFGDSRIEAIEGRLAALEVQNQNSLRGETRYAVAVAELYRAALSGERFDSELLEVEALLLDAAPIVRARTRSALEILRALDLAGVPAFFELQNEFTALISTLLVAERSQAADGFWAGVWSDIKELVVIRRTGEVDGTDLEAVLAQAEARLKGGDLEGALVLVEGLNARPDTLNQWLQRARARTSALAALQTLADSALEESEDGEAE